MIQRYYNKSYKKGLHKREGLTLQSTITNLLSEVARCGADMKKPPMGSTRRTFAKGICQNREFKEYREFRVSKFPKFSKFPNLFIIFVKKDGL